MRSLLFPAWIVLAACSGPLQSAAEPRFLVIGGGESPGSNQISLERNVLYFHRVRESLRLDQTACSVFFADGDSDRRDLQYRFDPPQDLRLELGRVLGSEDDLHLRYRSHEIRPVDGSAGRAALDRWFTDQAPKLAGDGPLVIYFTGHGGKGDKKTPRHTTMRLWGGSMKTGELAAHLERVPKDVPVVLVMVQCYSGGFADLLFREADESKGPADRPVCGFFSTVHDRTAAGCTPDVDEADYQEYSSHFWAALSGFNRLGEPVEKPDYDGDGRVSFEEAHAYTKIVSRTIDIPQKTSDRFLQHFVGDRAPPNADACKPDRADLATLARPADRAVLEKLAAELALDPARPYASAKEKADAARAEKKKLEDDLKKKNKEQRDARSRLAGHLKNRWPELGAPWHADVPALLEQESAAIGEALRGHADYPAFCRLQTETADLEDRSLASEKLWARLQRYIQTAESVARGHTLGLLEDPVLQSRYDALIRAESSGLGR